MNLNNFTFGDLWNTENSWSKSTKALWISIWVYVLSGILSTLCEWIDSLQNAQELFSMEFDMTPSEADVFSIIFSLLVIVGYVIFFRSIGNFANVQKEITDKKWVGDIKTAYLLILIAAACAFIPVLGGIAALVLLIIGYVKLLKAYKALSISPTWSASAQQGAASLRVAAILNLVAACVSWIPVVGPIAVIVLEIIAFIKLIKGWELIHNGEPVEQPTEEPAAEKAE